MSLTHHSPLCSDVLQRDHADGGLLRGHHHPGEYRHNHYQCRHLLLVELDQSDILASAVDEKRWKPPDVVSVAGME